MLSDEEKKVIEYLKEIYNDYESFFGKEDAEKCQVYKKTKTLIELIEKQQKEIEELKKGITYYNELEKEIEELKDKIKATIEEYVDYGTSIYYGLRSNGKAFHQAVRMEVKEVLQSLLEKE